jgi:hypothetical protein
VLSGVNFERTQRMLQLLGEGTRIGAHKSIAKTNTNTDCRIKATRLRITLIKVVSRVISKNRNTILARSKIDWIEDKPRSGNRLT